MIEEFRDIKGYEGLYQVSNLGNVKSLSRVVISSNGSSRTTKDRLLKKTISQGYFMITMCNNTKRKGNSVHQLVAIAFLNHIPNGHKIVVDHINNIRTDNRVENLQLITTRENNSKDRRGYTSKYIGVSWSKSANKWVSEIRINGVKKHLGVFSCQLEASKAYKKALSKLKKS